MLVGKDTLSSLQQSVIAVMLLDKNGGKVIGGAVSVVTHAIHIVRCSGRQSVEEDCRSLTGSTDRSHIVLKHDLFHRPRCRLYECTAKHTAITAVHKQRDVESGTRATSSDRNDLCRHWSRVFSSRYKDII